MRERISSKFKFILIADFIISAFLKTCRFLLHFVIPVPGSMPRNGSPGHVE